MENKTSGIMEQREREREGNEMVVRVRVGGRALDGDHRV